MTNFEIIKKNTKQVFIVLAHNIAVVDGSVGIWYLAGNKETGELVTVSEQKLRADFVLLTERSYLEIVMKKQNKTEEYAGD